MGAILGYSIVVLVGQANTTIGDVVVYLLRWIQNSSLLKGDWGGGGAGLLTALCSNIAVGSAFISATIVVRRRHSLVCRKVNVEIGINQFCDLNSFSDYWFARCFFVVACFDDDSIFYVIAQYCSICIPFCLRLIQKSRFCVYNV